VAPGYDDAIAPLMRPFAVTTLDLLGVTGETARLRLVDVAAGTGVVAVEAARRGAEVLATDFAPGMVELMRRRFASEGLVAGQRSWMAKRWIWKTKALTSGRRRSG
jgi:2-polyprenyl-3-methyl-5-hydroxy-6-metoxy-1,4-benzoquinol methylase